MSSDTYAIVFKGDILDGHDLATVKLELAKLLKLKPGPKLKLTGSALQSLK